MRPSWKILQGDCIERMRELPAGSVQCCVTSPPYFNLRDYGTATWEGGDPECDHKPPMAWTADSGDLGVRGGVLNANEAKAVKRHGKDCLKCGARRVDRQIGLERTPEEYVANLVAVFREVRRVLRDDGTAFLNIGDSYHGSWGNYSGQNRGKGSQREIVNGSQVENPGYDGLENFRPATANKHAILKEKDLCMIPWRVALALQEDGWWLRSVIAWTKKSPMPESVEDRPTSAWEPIFLLAKSQRYFYDHVAVREGAVGGTPGNKTHKGATAYAKGDEKMRTKVGLVNMTASTSRNMRNVWHLANEPYPESHFATFPSEIPRRAIMAGTSEKGCCSTCGAPWRRIVAREAVTRERPNDFTKRNGTDGTGNSCANSVAGVSLQTKGWEPSCDCNAPTRPCIVLDPFGGSGTTAQVAVALGREAIICELNADYIALAEKRIRTPLYKDDLPPKQVPSMPGQKALFGE